MQKSAILGALATSAVMAIGSSPSICMLSPLATITAGQTIFATIENPQGRPCAATLVYSDNNFLPVTFDLPPANCLGFQRAEVSVPLASPNGVVTILWECAGDGVQSCSRASIEGGLAVAENFDIQQTGLVACVVAAATQTTLRTLVQNGATTIDATVETIFSTIEPSTSTGSPVATTETSSTNSKFVAPTSDSKAPTTNAKGPVTIATTETSTLGNGDVTIITTTVIKTADQDASTAKKTPSASASNSASTSTSSTGTNNVKVAALNNTVVMVVPNTECSCSKSPMSTGTDTGSPFSKF